MQYIGTCILHSDLFLLNDDPGLAHQPITEGHMVFVYVPVILLFIFGCVTKVLGHYYYALKA